MNNIICGVDKDGRVYPLGIHYDEGTGLASLAVSRAGGKNTFTKEYAVQQANTVIVNPGAAQKVCVASVYVAGNGNAGEVTINFGVSAITVFKHYMTKYNYSGSSAMHIEGAVNENLLLTTSTGTDKVFIVVNYRLVS